MILSHHRPAVREKAGYGFAEAARLFWLAFRDAIIADDWKHSILESALFFKYHGAELIGIAGTHVDDLVAGVHPDREDDAFAHTRKIFKFGKWERDEFVFRGREIKRNQARSS